MGRNGHQTSTLRLRGVGQEANVHLYSPILLQNIDEESFQRGIAMGSARGGDYNQTGRTEKIGLVSS